MIKSKLKNYVMLNGKKSLAEQIFLKTSKKIQKNTSTKNYYDVLKLIIVNASPSIRIKQIQRKKKNTIEFPYLLTDKLKVFYGIKNILTVCRKGKGHFFYEQISKEFLNLTNAQGETAKFKKIEHEQAFLKKKFANYRWF